ncbi:MAG: metal ABC transporter ATP-binding protein [bacterium]
MSEARDIQISVKGVDFSYGSTKVLSDISFEIRQGDFLAILGPNGSGKTTLIKLVLGLLPLSEGEIVLFGQTIRTFAKWKSIGYVPQNATHIDHFFPASVKEVVSMGLISGKKFPRFLRRNDYALIDKALEKVDMKGIKDRRIGELSGGQQQRVFIARAVVNQPEILILDEPTAGVDAATQTHFYDMLNLLNKQLGITIVLITHDIGAVTRYVTKVACLNQRLVFHGTHEEFCQSSEVEKFIRGEQHLISHRH